MKVGIVGAGPAGFVCAIQLVKQGHNITLFESNSVNCNQGSGVLLQPVGLDALGTIGLREKVIALGRKIEAIIGRESINNKTIVDIDYKSLRKTSYAIGIDRTHLWQLLYRCCCQLGITIINDTCVHKVRKNKSDKLLLIDEKSIEHGNFDLVIDASGAHSSLRKLAVKPSQGQLQAYGSLWTQLPLSVGSLFDRDEMTLYSTHENEGVGILPTGVDDSTGQNMATLFFNLRWEEWRPDQFMNWKQKILGHWPSLEDILKPLVSSEQLYLAKFKQHTLRKPYGDQLAFIGDSAHASNPQLGQGINMALVDAIVLPWAIQNSHNSDIQDALSLYAKMRRNHVYVYQSLARLLTPFYQSKSRRAIFIRDVFYPLLMHLPLLKEFSAYIISGQLTNPLKKILR